MEFEGVLKKVIFSGDNGYKIAAVEDIKNDEEVIVVGYLELFKDQVYTFFGEMDTHTTYGEQFKIDKYVLKTPKKGEDIINFLSSDSFKGVGKRTAKKIVDYFEEQTLEILKNDPQEIIDKVKVKDTLVFEISATLNSLDGMDVLYELLDPLGFSRFYITEIFQYIKQKNILSIHNFITKNPYELSQNIESISFEKADKIFLYYKGDPNDFYRLVHAVLDEISVHCFRVGDTYINYEVLKKNMTTKLGFSIENFDDILEYLKKEKKIIINEEDIALYEFWDAEKKIASNISNRLDVLKLGLRAEVVEATINKIESENSINYSDLQKKAIINSLVNNISIITGGPGTGKTTIINAIVQIFKELKYKDQIIKYMDEKIVLCAPTGRAAQRMKETTGVEAKTIHSLLEWDPYKNEFQKGADNKLLQDLIIIDEFSMVDIFLGSAILRAIKPTAIVVIVGDSAQLESVNPGNILFDLIDTGKIPLIHLDRIFRQGDGSSIAKFAKDIDKGEKLEFINTTDMSLINKQVNLLNIIKQIVNKSYDSGYNEMEVQILYPKYSGSQGIDKINEYLLSNKDKPFVQGYEDIKFYVGDKVMQLKNNYDKNIYNGDIGKVLQVFNAKNPQDIAIEIEFRNKKITLLKKELLDLKHAYAISVHKSQGSEFKVIILPITQECEKMLNKKIIYTAITRAKDKLIVVGDLEVMRNNIFLDTPHRKTNLKNIFSRL